MPSRYAPEPDRISNRVIRFFVKRLSESGKNKEQIDKESRRFKSIYSSIIGHAMNRKGQTRREAHKYALKTYIEQAPGWAGILLIKKKDK